MIKQLPPVYRKLISAAVAIMSVAVVFLFVLYPARLEGSSTDTWQRPAPSHEEGAPDRNARGAKDAQDAQVNHDRPGETAMARDGVQAARGPAAQDSAGEEPAAKESAAKESAAKEPAAKNSIGEEPAGMGESRKGDPNRLGKGDRALVGSLFDRRTGRALETFDFVVEAFSHEDGHSVAPAEFSSSEGRFVLSGLPAGKYDVEVRADGYAPLRSTVSIPAAEEFRFELESPGSVRIRVTDPFARRLDPERIRLVDAKGDTQDARLPSRFENGYHVVTGLDEGIQSLRIEVPGFEPQELEALVDPEEPQSYWVVVE